MKPGKRTISVLKYTMVIEPAEDEKGRYYGAYFPDLPGCFTMGSSLKELQENARAAVTEHLSALVKRGKSIPDPRHRAKTVITPIPAQKAGGMR